MIPVIILIAWPFGGGVALRVLPLTVSAAILATVSIVWGVLVGDPWGIVVAAVNAAVGAGLGFVLVGLGTRLIQSSK